MYITIILYFTNFETFSVMKIISHNISKVQDGFFKPLNFFFQSTIVALGGFKIPQWFWGVSKYHSGLWGFKKTTVVLEGFKIIRGTYNLHSGGEERAYYGKGEGEEIRMKGKGRKEKREKSKEI